MTPVRDELVSSATVRGALTARMARLKAWLHLVSISRIEHDIGSKVKFIHISNRIAMKNGSRENKPNRSETPYC